MKKKNYLELAILLNKRFEQFGFKLVAESNKDAVRVIERICFKKEYIEYLVRFARNHDLEYEIHLLNYEMEFKLFYAKED